MAVIDKKDPLLVMRKMAHEKKAPLFIDQQDPLFFILQWNRQNPTAPLSEEAEKMLYAFTAKMMKEKRLKSGPFSRPKPNVGPGTLSEMFTEYVGSDKYGYIVTDVLDYGRVIKAKGYDTVKGEMKDVKGDLCLKWHPRLDHGRGLWLKLGEKYQRKGPYYIFGAAQNFMDPSF